MCLLYLFWCFQPVIVRLDQNYQVSAIWFSTLWRINRDQLPTPHEEGTGHVSKMVTGKAQPPVPKMGMRKAWPSVSKKNTKKVMAPISQMGKRKVRTKSPGWLQGKHGPSLQNEDEERTDHVPNPMMIRGRHSSLSPRWVGGRHGPSL
jgi:hypothetical protein